MLRALDPAEVTQGYLEHRRRVHRMAKRKARLAHRAWERFLAHERYLAGLSPEERWMLRLAAEVGLCLE